MSTEDKNNPIFTGGDGLTGLYKLYHEAMMKNELEGGHGAYELSYAGGESGFSFGGNQIDLSKKTGFSDDIVDIFENAKNDKRENFFTQKEVKKISGKDNENLIKSKDTLENTFGDYLKRIQSALSSEYGINKINELYLSEIENGAKHIEKAIEKIKNPAAKEFYSTDVGKLLLFDYNNQFYIQLDGALLKKYIDGVFNDDAKVVYSTGEKIVAPIDEYTIENHKEYIYSTKQYAERSSDCNRRLNNLNSIIENYKNNPEQYFPDASEDFSFSMKKGKWIILKNAELPKFDVPPPRGKTVILMNFLVQFNDPAIMILPNNSSLKGMSDFYYYLAKDKRLLHISPQTNKTYSPPGSDNDNNWSLIKYIMIERDYMPYDNTGNWINVANYIMYTVRIKEVLVEKNELLSWLGDSIVEESDNLSIATVQNNAFLVKNDADFSPKPLKNKGLKIFDENMSENSNETLSKLSNTDKNNKENINKEILSSKLEDIPDFIEVEEANYTLNSPINPLQSKEISLDLFLQKEITSPFQPNETLSLEEIISLNTEQSQDLSVLEEVIREIAIIDPLESNVLFAKEDNMPIFIEQGNGAVFALYLTDITQHQQI